MADDDLVEEARARRRLHDGWRLHQPLSPNGDLIGLRGEEALAATFGLSIDLVRRPFGDGGADNVLVLDGKPYRVDVKCARKPVYLLVPIGKVQPRTIYVLARYDDRFDTASLLGWQWGTVIAKMPTRDFGYGVVNHYIARGELRDIGELMERSR